LAMPAAGFGVTDEEPLEGYDRGYGWRFRRD
jgi:hypothetical protein